MSGLRWVMMVALAMVVGLGTVRADGDELAALQRETCSLLLKGRAQEAVRQLDEAKLDARWSGQTAPLDELRSLAMAAADIDPLVLMAIKSVEGQELTLHLVRETVTGTVGSVSIKTFVLTKAATDASGKPARVALRVGDLGNDEIMRWLAKSTAKWAPLVRGMRAWQWGQRDLARECFKSVDHPFGKLLLELAG